MNVIFGRHNADLLAQRYLVLELETFNAVECFFVMPWEELVAMDMPTVKHYAHLHQRLVENLAKKNYPVCQDLIEHLMGKFNGQVDSFYENILERINSRV